MTAALLLALLAQRGIPGRNGNDDELRADRWLHFAARRPEIPRGLGFGGAGLSIDDEFGTRTRAFTMPFRDLPGEDPAEPQPGDLRPVIEGGAGYIRGTGRTADLFNGGLPGQELGVDMEWDTYGAEAGGGLEIYLGDGFRIAPVALVGIQHVENDADYSGPGAPTRGPPLDGVVFNWDATVFSYGGAMRAEGSWTIGSDLRLTSVFRYDYRGYETIDSTTSAQEDVDAAQLFTLSNVLQGRFGFRILDRPAGWRGLLLYRRAAGDAADTLGFVDSIEIGGILDVGLGGVTAFPSGASLGGTLIWGPDVHGWSLSLDLSF